jgi:molybdopterin molybdotransferase
VSERVLTFEQALHEVLHHAEVLTHARSLAVVRRAERAELLAAAGRVLAAAVVADRDQPPFDRATRDGYAVRAHDAERSALRVVGSVRAGESWLGAALAEGEAIEIMTGAPLPAGADAVVMVEHTTLADGLLHVEAGRTLRAGENVVPRGAETRAGNVVLPAGQVLGAAEIGVAASCGMAQVQVFAQPTVAIIATGDELVELDEPMDAWQIRNSNSYALAALVRAEGGFAGRLKVARDTRADLSQRLFQGGVWDLMLLSGGVSMGKYDLVEQMLAEFGAEFFFTGALIQPGKPVVFGRLPKRFHFRVDAGEFRVRDEGPWNGEWTYFFGLPGNPVSAQVCFHLFVAPMLRALAGRTEIAPVFVEARLAEDVKGGARVTRFLPAQLTSAWDGVTVRVVGWQGSGDVVANARGNGYAVLPACVESFSKGETVRVLLR